MARYEDTFKCLLCCLFQLFEITWITFIILFYMVRDYSTIHKKKQPYNLFYCVADHISTTNIVLLFPFSLQGVGLLLHYIENGNSANEIIRASSKICANFRIETPRVCSGIIEIMAVRFLQKSFFLDLTII